MTRLPSPCSLAQVICPSCRAHIEKPLCEVKAQPVFRCRSCGNAIDAGRLARILERVEEEFADLPPRPQSAPKRETDSVDSTACPVPLSLQECESGRSPYVTRGWVVDLGPKPADLGSNAGSASLPRRRGGSSRLGQEQPKDAVTKRG